MGLQVSPSDYQRLAKFRLSLCWIDVLPQDVYLKIHPLSTAKSKEAWKLAHNLLDACQKPDLLGLKPHLQAGDERGRGREWLLQRDSDRVHEVVVLWDESTAVLMEWGVFCDFWDCFCNPSSHDVIILPLSAQWLLLYEQDEIFHFGRPKA